jgi:ribosomal-protein-alanine N-acetyltransferase
MECKEVITLENVVNDFVSKEMSDHHLNGVLRLEQLANKRPQSAQQFLKEIHSPTYINLVGNINSETVIGFCVGQVIGDELHIYSLVVDPEYRRLGYGKMLIEELIERSKSQGVIRATLEVRISNNVAISLYSNLGFKPAGVREKYYIDNGEDASIMWFDFNERERKC